MTALDWAEAAAKLFEPSPDARYLSDPAAWATDKLGVHLWSKQREIFESVTQNRRTAVKSCHGAGKSFSAGALAAWWIDTHPPGEAIVVSTAPTYKQVHAVLWEEIRKQHRTDGHGIPVQFTSTADERGNVTLTTQELEGLMRTGGWEPGTVPVRKSFAERIREAYPDGLPAATWETPEDLARMSIEAHARQQQEKTP